MVAGDRGAGRDHRHRLAAADHELQSSLHHQRAHLFCGDPRVPVGQGARHRGAGPAQHAAQGRRCAVPCRPAAVSIRRRPEEGGAGRSGAERAAAQSLARPGDRRRRKGHCAIRAGATELRPASGTVRKEGHRAGHPRYFHPQSRNSEAVGGGGESRGGARAPRVFIQHRRRQHHGRPADLPNSPMLSGISSRP